MEKIGRKNRNYNAEFKISVIMDMREQHLGYRETARKYELGTSGSVVDTLKRWEWTIVKKVDRGMRKISKAQPRHAGRTKVQPD